MRRYVSNVSPADVADPNDLLAEVATPRRLYRAILERIRWFAVLLDRLLRQRRYARPALFPSRSVAPAR